MKLDDLLKNQNFSIILVGTKKTGKTGDGSVSWPKIASGIIIYMGDIMPRGARKKSDNGTYHIMLRGINKQQIFE